MNDLREFVQGRYSDLLRTAFLLAGSLPEAEDLVQTTLLRAMRRWDGIDDPLPYLRRTIVNLYLNGLRRRTRELLTGLPPEKPVRDLEAIGATGAAIVADDLRTTGDVPTHNVSDWR